MNNAKKVLIGIGCIAIILVTVCCAITIWFAYSFDMFWGSNEATEREVDFAQALTIFDLPSDIKNEGNYRFHTDGFLDHIYETSFLTDVASIEKIVQTYDLDNKEDIYDADDSYPLGESMINMQKLCRNKPQQYEIEISDLDHAEIILCAGDSDYDYWYVYIEGFTT